jgi:hypothetical protein
MLKHKKTKKETIKKNIIKTGSQKYETNKKKQKNALKVKKSTNIKKYLILCRQYVIKLNI